MNSPAKTNEVMVERIFNAPCEMVFKAWSEPEQVMKWWGPEGTTSPSCTIDFRVGGKYLFCVRSPEGDMWVMGFYKEIVPNERLVFSQSFADADGNFVSAAQFGMSEEFDTTEVIVSFVELEKGKTKLTLRHLGFPATDEMIASGQEGWGGSFDKLEAALA